VTEPARFTKMSGAGNDFIVLDGLVADALGGGLSGWIQAVCRRGVAVGADGVLVVRAMEQGRISVEFWNPDGSTAFCGNGTRCAARYAYLNGLSGPASVLVTAVGEVPAVVDQGGTVRLTLPPVLDHGMRTLDAGGESLTGRFVLAGVPHFVVQVGDVAEAPIERWGPVVRSHPDFGEAGTNLDLISCTDSGEVHIRTWERGVEGETLACGTGAVAAGATVAMERGGGEVVVRPWSGAALSVMLDGNPGAHTAVVLAGDARVVFRGELDPEALNLPEPDRTV
jgi:diaminopimelate epimerase